MIFKCTDNPELRLRAGKVLIQFQGGKYETEDPDEIKVLQACPMSIKPVIERKPKAGSAEKEG